MNRNELEYYNQEAVWEQDMTPGQFETVKKLNCMFEKLKISSLLDVGCGNGFLVNSLPESIGSVGMDISESALRHVRGEKIIGSVDSIPFPDKSFEMVVCSDVLEHLTEVQFARGMAEIQRVAKKYVTLVFPYREDLDYSRTKCHSCGCQFHINWHLRSMDIEKIQLQLREFSPVCVQYAGEEWPASIGIIGEIQRTLDGGFVFWDKAVCPHCNAKQEPKTSGEQEALQLAVQELMGTLMTDKTLIDSMTEDQSMITKNEIILLLERREEEKDEEGIASLQNKVFLGTTSMRTDVWKNMRCYDNDRILHLWDTSKIKTSILKYPKMPYIVDTESWGPIETISDKQARRYAGKDRAEDHAVFVFPRNGREINNIVIHYNNLSASSITVQVYDVEKKYISIGELTPGRGWQRKEIRIPSSIKTGEEGYIFDLLSLKQLETQCYIAEIFADDGKEDILSSVCPPYSSSIGASQVLLSSEALLARNLQFVVTVPNFEDEWFLQIDSIKIFLDYEKHADCITFLVYSWFFDEPYFKKKFSQEPVAKKQNALSLVKRLLDITRTKKKCFFSGTF